MQEGRRDGLHQQQPGRGGGKLPVRTQDSHPEVQGISRQKGNSLAVHLAPGLWTEVEIMRGSFQIIQNHLIFTE